MRWPHFLILCVIAGSATNCAPPASLQNKATCNIDHSERLAWAEWTPDMDVEGAAIFTYQGCGKRLDFVATSHTNDPNSDTFKAVRQAAAFKPEAILIEGVPADYGPSLPQLSQMAAQANGTPSDTEAMLSVRLAESNAIPFQGAEPLDTEIVALVKDQGLSPLDLIGFYTLRQLPQIQRAGEVGGPNDPRMERVLADTARYFATEIGETEDFAGPLTTLEGFSAWYHAFNDESFAEDFDARDVYPSAGVDTPRASNRASDIVADARDAFILEQIETALNAYDHVVIVYGGSHHSVQRSALEAAFGTAAQTF
jgi:hypothetical protein